MNRTWVGKLVGGAFGFLLGGPLGALLGVALGAKFDRGIPEFKLLEADLAPSTRQRVQMAFFTATFSVMGHIAKADGRVTEAEIAAARSIMDRMELPEELRRTAVRLFNEGKRPDFPLDGTLDQFHAECQRRHTLLRMFVEIQMEAALSDGALHAIEERLLLRLCQRLRVSQFEFHALKARMEAERRFSARFKNGRHQSGQQEALPGAEPSLTDAYAVLSLGASADEREIKRNYRRLMSQHHPDKLVAKGLPEEMVRIATEKTQQIRKAYEVIAKARKF